MAVRWPEFPDDATAYAHRDARHDINIAATWLPDGPTRIAALPGGLRDVARAIRAGPVGAGLVDSLPISWPTAYGAHTICFVNVGLRDNHERQNRGDEPASQAGTPQRMRLPQHPPLPRPRTVALRSTSVSKSDVAPLR